MREVEDWLRGIEGSIHAPPHTHNLPCRPSMREVEDRLQCIEGSGALNGYTSYQEGGCCGACTVS